MVWLQYICTDTPFIRLRQHVHSSDYKLTTHCLILIIFGINRTIIAVESRLISPHLLASAPAGGREFPPEPTQLAEAATKSSPTILQKRLLGGCTIDVSPSSCHRRAFDFAARYLEGWRQWLAQGGKCTAQVAMAVAGSQRAQTNRRHDDDSRKLRRTADDTGSWYSALSDTAAATFDE